MPADDGNPGSCGKDGPTSGRPRRRALSPWILIVAGAVLVAAVAAWQIYATWWTNRSEVAGKALVHHFLEDHALGAALRVPAHTSGTSAAAMASLAACSASGARTPVHGLLEIPSLGVVAPVEQGDGGDVLAVAVGHDSSSAWPGNAGNAVLLAHDVSYFRAIDRLQPGEAIRYVTPCTTYVFDVSSHTVVAAGSPVYDTAAPTLTLVTCWPTDALWFTPDRYLVTAAEVSYGQTGRARHHYPTAERSLTVPVPAALASEGVTLATYALPMGTLSLAGSPSSAWAQSTRPLLVDDSAVEAFIAGVRALTAGRLGWWRAIAPGVDAPAPLLGAHEPHYLSATDVTERADGSTVSTVTLSDTVSVTGGRRPGRYTMTVRATIHGHTMTISSWSMAPA